MQLIEKVKKRLELKGWDFASDYWDDEEIANLHEVILETEAALTGNTGIRELSCDCCGCHPNVIYTTKEGVLVAESADNSTSVRKITKNEFIVKNKLVDINDNRSAYDLNNCCFAKKQKYEQR